MSSDLPPAQHWDQMVLDRAASVRGDDPSLRCRAISLLISSVLMAVVQCFAAGHLLAATGEDAITHAVAPWHSEIISRWRGMCLSDTLIPLAEHFCAIINAVPMPSSASDCVAIFFASLVIALTVAEESKGVRREHTEAPPSFVPPRRNQLAG